MAVAPKSVSVVLKSRDTNGNDMNTRIGYINPDLMSDVSASASTIDTCCRALLSLSTNSYVDAVLTAEYSVKDILADD